jgi:hypothetical protein
MSDDQAERKEPDVFAGTLRAEAMPWHGLPTVPQRGFIRIVPGYFSMTPEHSDGSC